MTGSRSEASPPPPDDDDNRPSFSPTPVPGPSVPPRQPPMSRSSSGAAEHSGYFPPTSPRRVSLSNSRYHTPSSARGHRSTSVSTAGPILDEDPRDVNDADNDDDDDDDNDNGRGDDMRSSRVATAEDPDREFTEDDPLTLKDRQSLINVEHPFGLPIWKPALYKKSRTVTRDAETELHSVPSATIERHFIPGNVLWMLLFGWWLALAASLVAIVLSLVPFGGTRYSRLVFGLAWYIFWPFGKYVEGDVEDDAQSKTGDEEEHVGNGVTAGTARTRSTIPESAQEATHPSIPSGGVPLTTHSTTSTITPGRIHRESPSWTSDPATERASFPAASVKAYGATDVPAKAASSPADYSLGTVAFSLAFICILGPIFLFVTLACWALVFTIPMAKLNWELLTHLWKRPLHIRFCSAPPPTVLPAPRDSQSTYTIHRTHLTAGQDAPLLSGSRRSTVLLCTYRAMGLRYYKYTVGGVNIMFINLLPVVFFVIFDDFVLVPLAERRNLSGLLGFLAKRGLVFILSLLSVIPLSYFIGMAVASISAQSSIGMGAVINATFGSIIEIILYAIALTQGKGALVEGSIVGSILAGVLLMPGLSMCGSAVRQKEQKFNAKSAGVTSTMLIMAIIGVLTPTMFYQVYGNFQLTCDGCPEKLPDGPKSAPLRCNRCYYEHTDPTTDPFYQNTVKEFMYFCAGILIFSYLIGLWFSLRTHASQIWQNPQQLMNPLDLNRMSLYHRLTHGPYTLGTPGQSLPTHHQPLQRKSSSATTTGSVAGGMQTPRPISPVLTRRPTSSQVPSTSQPQQPPLAAPGQTQGPLPLPHGMYSPLVETVSHAVKTAEQLPHNMTTDDFTRAVAVATVSALRNQRPVPGHGVHHEEGAGAPSATGGHGGGGHAAPSWSRAVSASVLLTCTFLFAIIAEILVGMVDFVLEGSGVQEKFLGITLFALVPNTTEFMNAILFAMNGNIALSMEIGSAYALQVCLLQIPAMVAFSAWYDPRHLGSAASTFTLLFPRWDVIAIILSIFLLTYTYIEAKANYHRGSILVLSYVVLAAGFYYAPSVPGGDVGPVLDRVQFPPGDPVAEWPTSTFVEGVRMFLFTR